MLSYVRLWLRAELESERHGLNYLGSPLRGALGAALKRGVCVVSHGQCARCAVREACLYPRIFEGALPEGLGAQRRYTAAPQPFALDVAAPGQWRGKPTELLWGVTLFGRAIHAWPFVLEAFVRAGRRGLGRRRTPYRILEVRDGTTGLALWRGDGQALRQPAQSWAGAAAGGAWTSERVRIRFCTPVHLRSDGKTALNVTGPLLVASARRRWRLMRAFHSDEPEWTQPPPPQPDWSAFRTVHSDLRFWGINRYSARQKRRVPLCGLLGEVVVEGPWETEQEALRAVEAVHLGKHATFGLGRVEVEAA